MCRLKNQMQTYRPLNVENVFGKNVVVHSARLRLNGSELESPLEEILLPDENNEFLFLIGRSGELDSHSIEIVDSFGK